MTTLPLPTYLSCLLACLQSLDSLFFCCGSRFFLLLHGGGKIEFSNRSSTLQCLLPSKNFHQYHPALRKSLHTLRGDVAHIVFFFVAFDTISRCIRFRPDIFIFTTSGGSFRISDARQFVQQIAIQS